MTPSAVDRRDRLARKTERALTLLTVLAAIEILRRTPRPLLVVVAVVAAALVELALVYLAWIEAALAAAVAWKLGRGFARGWREAR